MCSHHSIREPDSGAAHGPLLVEVCVHVSEMERESVCAYVCVSKALMDTTVQEFGLRQ